MQYLVTGNNVLSSLLLKLSYKNEINRVFGYMNVKIDNNECGGNNTSCGRRLQLAVLLEISNIMVSLTGQEEMLRRILEILEAKLELLHGTIMLVDRNKDALIVGTMAEAVDAGNKNAVYRKGEGIVGQVMLSGRTEIIPKIADEPRFQGRIHSRSEHNRELLSFICVPIILGSETAGTLSCDLSFRSKDCLEEVAQFLTIVAGIIAHDVHNRRQLRLERESLESENRRLCNALQDKFRPENIIGDSSSMREVFTRIYQVAPADTTVLIRGESGTGKELVASAIHYNSSRASKPLVRVNCAALNENLLESELFGHEKGAFTGAVARRIGRLEEAEGGTLFLDEIGDFSPAVQVKLLRVIQEKIYERVGSSQSRSANVRIIAATNRDLEAAIDTGAFRQDLYYRINVFSIILPPLRDRKSDIMLLANHFAEKYGKLMNKRIERISTTAITMLTAYSWPGNVRELENCIEHAVLLSGDGVIQGYCLPQTLQMPQNKDIPAGSLKHQIGLMERDVLTDALKRNSGNVSAVARELGITGRMVRYKLANLGINPHKFNYRRNR